MSVGADSTITYFPVGNGDTTLIQLSGDRTSVLIDLNVTVDSGDEEKAERYNVHDHLLRECRYDANKRPHLDAFILTHADQDHIRGVTNVLFLGDPGDYDDDDRDAGRIIVDELWFAPRIFNKDEDLSEDAQAYLDEATRRVKLYKAGGAARTAAGNRLRVIGYSTDEAVKGLEDVTTVPGNTVNVINERVRADFSFFVHAPFKADTDGDAERNDTSIVLQARFGVGDDLRAGLALFGGDAGCRIWEKIVEASDAESLEWDLLLAPHHCSWTFFSEESSSDGEPSEQVLELLDSRREGAVVVASSNPIKDDDNNPPHHRAAKIYRERVGDEHLLCTMEHPSEDDPAPILYSMTSNGPVKDEFATPSQVKSSAARREAVTTPKTYG